MDALLNIDTYLDKFFQIQSRREDARKSLEIAIAALSTGGKGLAAQLTQEELALKEKIARLWLTRVERWAHNTKSSMIEDGVPAPGKAGSTWLLFRTLECMTVRGIVLV